MKTRIVFRDAWYYPQTKKFIFWSYIWYDGRYVAFKLQQDAIDFVESDKYIYNNKVVYKGTK